MNFALRSLRHVALVATVALSTLAPASATMLMDDMFVTPDAFLGGLGTQLASTTQRVNGINALGETAFAGLLRAAVYRRANDGGMTFYYQYLADASSPAYSIVNRMTSTSFVNYSTNVSYTTNTFDLFSDLGTVLATSADRSDTDAATPNDGKSVGFDRFKGGAKNGISAGEISRILAIRTNASTYVPGTTSLINGGVATLETYAPAGRRIDDTTPEVPEPSTFALLGGGLLGLATLARRRRS